MLGIVGFKSKVLTEVVLVTSMLSALRVTIGGMKFPVLLSYLQVDQHSAQVSW